MSRARLTYAIEQLEGRRLLTANINGTASDDTFVITVGDHNEISLIFNGVPEAVAPSADGKMEVHGFGGNDEISLLNTGTLTFFLFGELGDDHFNVGNGNLKSDIHRDVLIIEPAFAGNDTCVVNDRFGGGTTYSTDDDSVQFLSISSPAIVLPSMIDSGDGATILGSNGDDALIVHDFPRKTLFDLGSGDDTAHLGGTQNIVVPDLPATSKIDGGPGSLDAVILDDSNPNSPRTDLRFDDEGLVGGIKLDNFRDLNVTTHQLPGDQPEPVTFRGGACVTPFVRVVGSVGADLVQIGEPGLGVFARLYVDHMIMDLGFGHNQVELHEAPTLASDSWRFLDNQLENASGGPTSISGIGNIDFLLEGTQQNDTYTIVDTPDHWGITIDALGGNDRLEMGATKDLDDVFDTVKFKFIGGAGVDTMDLSDINDAVGDADDYTIGDFISKGDFQTTTFPVLEQSFVDNLLLQLDNDPNRVFFDLADFSDVQISGNGGNDTFIDRDEIVSPSNRLSSTLAKNALFLGGGGNDVLSLDDAAGAASTYLISGFAFSQIQNGKTCNLSYDSFSTIELTGADADNSSVITQRPVGATLNFVAGGGNDSLTIGGGDLDNSGLMSSGITLTGGTGTDSITFDDHLDSDASGEVETYTFGSLTLAKGTPTIIYTSFEEQTLIAANGIVPGQFNSVPVVNLNSLSGSVESTTINGGAVRGCIVNVSNGNLTGVAGTLALDLPGGTINFNDQNATVARSYQISATEMTSPMPVTFSGATALTLNGGPLNDNFIIRGSAAGTAAVFNGNGGNDFITVGDGFGSNYASPVSVNGNAGTDFVRFSSTSGTAFFSGTLRSTSFTSNSLSHSYASFENVIVQSGDEGSDITIQSVPQLTLPAISMTEFAGGSGDDLVTISTGSLGSIRGNVAVTGGGGNDTMVLNDTSGSGGTYTFDQGDRFFKGTTVGITITRDRGVEQEVLQSSGGNDTINVQDANEPLTILSNGGNDSITVLDASDPVTVNTGPENTAATAAPFGDSVDIRDGTTVVEQDDAVLGLSVAQGTTLRVAGGAVLSKSSGTGGVFSLAGTIDLAGGSLLARVGGPSLASLQTFLTRGFNAGAWNGTNAAGAINSSLAAGSPIKDTLGYGLGSQIGVTTIGPFSITAGDTLLRYTLEGDANLDASVNISDLGILATNWQATGAAWSKADFNYDGLVNITDLGAVASNWQNSLPPPAPAPARHLSRLIEGPPPVRSQRGSETMVGDILDAS